MKPTRRSLSIATIAAAVLAGTLPSAAQISLASTGIRFPDGRVQTTAAVGGGTPISDAIVAGGLAPCNDGSPGYPCTLTGPGHYTLTSDLTVPDQNTDAIVLSGLGTYLIDLNGHTIRGPNDCTSTCTFPGTGVGIRDMAPSGLSDLRPLDVRNGTILGMGSHGVVSFFQVKLANLHLLSNGGDGLHADTVHVEATIDGCFATFNGGSGFRSTAGNVRASAARANHGAGFVIGASGTVESCHATQNGGSGIEVGTTSVVRGCTSRDNQGAGISLASACLVVESTVVGNADYGLKSVVGGDLPGYTGCVLTANSPANTNEGGSQDLVNLGHNVCGSGTTCP